MLASEAAASPDPFLRGVAQLSVGFGHVCVVKTGGAVVCWGDNAAGQVGVGTNGRSVATQLDKPHIVGGLPKIARVSAGSMHTCALAVDGKVFCWGSAGGDFKSGPGGASGSIELRGPALGHPVEVPLGDGTARAIAVGPRDACAAFADEVRCWTTFQSIPIDARTITAPKLRTVKLAGASSMAMGHGKVCAVTPKGLACWREGLAPSLATWAPNDRIAPVSVSIGEMYACVASAAGEARCWFSLIDDFWKRAPDKVIRWPGKRPTRAIAVGDSPICTADARGTVDCFLSDEQGLPDQAAAGSWATTKLASHPIAGIDGAIDVGTSHSRNAFGYGFGCALRNAPDERGAQVFCWGDNEMGQLGRGGTKATTTAVPVVGP